MRLNFFAQNHNVEHSEPGADQPGAAAPTPLTGKTFPADEVVWGIVIRNGFDELDDPWYHKGTTQHAYLEGNDNVAICGFRPPQSGPRSRRRTRLGLPSAGQHPMCGACARLVVAPRPRVPVPVQGSRPPVAVPVTAPQQPVPVPVARHAPAPAGAPTAAAPAGTPTAPAPAAPAAQTAEPSVSPWIANRTDASSGQPADTTTIEMGTRHESGLLRRGVHTDIED